MANRIREFRKKRQLTQLQLALRIDSSKQQIYRLEKGHSDLTHDWLKRIAAVLDCEPWELLDADSAGLYKHERALRHSMSNRIRELREKNHLTQEELAKKIGSGHQQIYKLETGRADLTQKWLRRLAPALNCEPWELLDTTGGGLSDDERDILNSYRSLPDDQRRAIHAYFMAGHKNNIIAGYNDLSKADRDVVDWFLFEQRTVMR